MKNSSLSILFVAIAALVLPGCMRAIWDGLPPGVESPELTGEEWLNVADGEVPRIADHRGRPILLEFWSKDCPPCRRHVEVIQRVDAAYVDLEVLSVHLSLDGEEPAQDPRAIADYLEQRGIAYPVGVDQSGGEWERYEFNYLPHAVLLDETGRVAWSGNLVVYDLEHHLERILGPAPERVPGDEPFLMVKPAAGEPGFQELADGSNCSGGVCAPR